MSEAFPVLVVTIGVIGFLYLTALVGRIAHRLAEQQTLLTSIIAQISNLDRKFKRSVDLLEDHRAGKGPEADCARMFHEAEEQKAALFQLLKRSDSNQGNRIASGLKKEVLRLYQDLIRKFPDSREAKIARERCEEIERTALPTEPVGK